MVYSTEGTHMWRRQEPVRATVANYDPGNAIKTRGRTLEEFRVSQDMISRQKTITLVALLMMS